MGSTGLKRFFSQYFDKISIGVALIVLGAYLFFYLFNAPEDKGAKEIRDASRRIETAIKNNRIPEIKLPDYLSGLNAWNEPLKSRPPDPKDPWVIYKKPILQEIQDDTSDLHESPTKYYLPVPRLSASAPDIKGVRLTWVWDEKSFPEGYTPSILDKLDPPQRYELQRKQVTEKRFRTIFTVRPRRKDQRRFTYEDKGVVSKALYVYRVVAYTTEGRVINKQAISKEVQLAGRIPSPFRISYEGGRIKRRGKPPLVTVIVEKYEAGLGKWVKAQFTLEPGQKIGAPEKVGRRVVDFTTNYTLVEFQEDVKFKRNVRRCGPDHNPPIVTVQEEVKITRIVYKDDEGNVVELPESSSKTRDRTDFCGKWDCPNKRRR
jgi:hypothetical protein